MFSLGIDLGGIFLGGRMARSVDLTSEFFRGSRRDLLLLWNNLHAIYQSYFFFHPSRPFAI